MSIKRKSEELTYRPRIDLTGPDGNAYFLLGYASRWGKELGKDTARIHKEMTSGDYHNLVRVFEREFGDHCDLIGADELMDNL
jgi:hypothetical protein